MDHKQIKYFLEIVKHGSFQSAASALGLTQPALSQQIGLLEREYKESLFYRSKTGVQLTHKGSVFHSYAIQMNKLWMEVEEGMRYEGEILAGHFTIAAGGTVSAWILPKLIKKILKNSPQISISVIEGDNVETKELLKNGTVDLAILTSPFIPDRLIQTIPFLSDKIVPIVEKDHPLLHKKNLSVHDVVEERFVYYHQTSAIRMSLEKSWKKNKVHFQPKIIMELRSIESIVKSVEAGLGIGFISPFALTSKVRILHISKLYGEREYLIAFKKNSRANIALLAEKFQDMIAK
jgi:DNA-binding transcriptional LysR family regulator